MTTTTDASGGIIAAASLSVVSTLGFIGTCLMQHKDVIMEKFRCCWTSWVERDKDDDIEAQRQSTMTTQQTPQSLYPSITFPIVINNHPDKKSTPGSVMLPSPFDSRYHDRHQDRHHDKHYDKHHDRHHDKHHNNHTIERVYSCPTSNTSPDISDFSDLSPDSRERHSVDNSSSSSDPVIFRTLENRRSY